MNRSVAIIEECYDCFTVDMPYPHESTLSAADLNELAFEYWKAQPDNDHPFFRGAKKTTYKGPTFNTPGLPPMDVDSMQVVDNKDGEVYVFRFKPPFLTVDEWFAKAGGGQAAG